jgi:hypothetical protein
MLSGRDAVDATRLTGPPGQRGPSGPAVAQKETAMPAESAAAMPAAASRLRALVTALLILSLLIPGALRPLPAHAQGATGAVLAPGSPPLTRQTTDAFADTMVFILQVVANGDTWDLERADDAALKNGMAQGLAAGYAAFPADAQQALAQMPELRSVLYQAWPLLDEDDREELRDQLRPSAQSMLDGMDCQTFVGLADADFVEATTANIARYRSCQRESAPAAAAVPQPTAAPKPAQPNPVAQQAQPNAAYRAASQGLMDSHNTYINMSNVLTQNHAANMNAILTMGGSNYRYEVKYGR